MLIKWVDWSGDPRQNVFSSPAYLRALGQAGGIEKTGWLGGEEGGVLRFVLPFAIKKKAIFRYIQFQSQTILLDDAATIGDEKAFLDAVLVFLKGQGVDF